MIELLMVVVIISIMTALIVPTVTGTDTARITTASRALMQMSRYARTMAVLRQQTLTLQITSDGTLSVTAADGSASAAPDAEEQPGEPAEARHITTAPAAGPEKGAAPDGGGGQNLISDVNAIRKFKQVRFAAEIDPEALDADEAGTELQSEEKGEEPSADGKSDKPALKTVSIPYEANGRCLPYRVTITPDGTEEGKEADKMVVIVDRFGNAKVEDEDNGK
jgi:type II secretory pathway pseudopilin PulG